MSELPLDCEYELASDPVILFAKRLLAQIHAREVRGIRAMAFHYPDCALAEHAAEKRRAEILAKHGVGRCVEKGCKDTQEPGFLRCSRHAAEHYEDESANV